jgi:hypothetical protein
MMSKANHWLGCNHYTAAGTSDELRPSGQSSNSASRTLRTILCREPDISIWEDG